VLKALEEESIASSDEKATSYRDAHCGDGASSMQHSNGERNEIKVISSTQRMVGAKGNEDVSVACV